MGDQRRLLLERRSSEACSAMRKNPLVFKNVPNLDRSRSFGPVGPVPPRAALVDRPDYLTWPHIEHDGILCLLNNLSEVDPNNPGPVALNIVNRAVRLVEELIEGKIVERDFREEFLTYWFYDASSSVRDVVTLFDPPRSSCIMRYFNHEGVTYVGRDDDELARWISNRFGEKAGRHLRNRTEQVAYIWLSKPPLPKEYPRFGADVMTLAQRDSEENAQLLSESALHEAADLLCLFAAEGRGGPGIVPVHIDRNVKQKGLSQRAKGQFHTGFRPGKTPGTIKLTKTFGANAVRRTQVARADGPWVHGRGKDTRSHDLLGSILRVRPPGTGCCLTYWNRSDPKIATVTADSAYDTRKCHDVIAA